jgi:hypothetical protein
MHMQNEQSKLDRQLQVQARLDALFECPKIWSQDAVRFLITRDEYLTEVEFLVLPYTGNRQEYLDKIIEFVFPSGLTYDQVVFAKSYMRKYVRTWYKSCSTPNSSHLLTYGYLMECPQLELWRSTW